MPMVILNDHPAGIKKCYAIYKTANGSTAKARKTRPVKPSLLAHFLAAFKTIEGHKNGKPFFVDGSTLSIAAVAAAARHNAIVELDASLKIKERVFRSRNVITDKVAKGTSVYGLSTGFGGSADTRTNDTLALGSALLQHQHAGVLPTSTRPCDVLPLLDPLSSTSMPESWVKGAILIRMNSLIRGHSGVRWELIEKMSELLRANITPVVPLRGSISASGDLSPLSYLAGALVGNPSIRVFAGQAAFGARETFPSCTALAAHNIETLSLQSKEHLGILNGTAFSASVAALALNDVVHLALLAQVCTAMGTEALLGSRGSYHHFIHAVARPHLGQVEVARNIWDLLAGSKFAVAHEQEVSIVQDQGRLRQDRYPLRTAPQFLGPQVEDILSALAAVTQECNSTTDNPLIDGETGDVHHGGNFQAMAITNAMEKTRLSLHHIGKLLFAQCAELLNPAMNRGLPPSLAATDPSINYFGKGIDIATAAYVGELGCLANPVSTHVQSAEMHNQAINSLALISARATINALDILSMLTASYIYVLCQALDLRALQAEFIGGLGNITSEELRHALSSVLSVDELSCVTQSVTRVMQDIFESTSTMDAADRMQRVAASGTIPLFDFVTGPGFHDTSSTSLALASIPAFRTKVASRSADLLNRLRGEYLSGARGMTPASQYLGKTRAVYEFVRVTLGIKMHGFDNFTRFSNGLGEEDVTIGQNVSLIYEAIRDGKMQAVVARLFS